MILGFTNDQLTQFGHLVIIFIGLSAYYKATKTKNLIEIQQKTIEALDKEVNTLQRGFEACRSRLAELEKKIDKGVE